MYTHNIYIYIYDFIHHNTTTNNNNNNNIVILLRCLIIMYNNMNEHTASISQQATICCASFVFGQIENMFLAQDKGGPRKGGFLSNR